jgi:hypothetical protein
MEVHEDKCIERITPNDAFVELRFTQNGHRQTEHEFVRTNKDTDNSPSIAVNFDMSNVFRKLQVVSEWQNLYDTDHVVERSIWADLMNYV